MEPLSPRVLLLWRVTWLLGLIPLLLAAAIVVLLLDDVVPLLRFGVPAVAIGSWLAAAIVVPGATYRRWRYSVTDDGLELRHGLIVRQESSIPNFRVQHIDLQQGPIDRALGIVRLRISTASPASDAVLPGVELERAEAIRARILARAEADDGV